MNVYVVYGNIFYDGCCGDFEDIFGIYTEKSNAEVRRDSMIKELYEREMENKYTRVSDISDIEVDILEIELDEAVEMGLGGFIGYQVKNRSDDKFKEENAMRKERNDSVVEVWDRDYINFPNERNEEDKEAQIIQIEHGHEDDYIVEIVRG